MDIRDFGTTGIRVSALGLGTGHLGDESLSAKDAEHLLNRAVDMGITLFDTARGYERSEERIGKYLSHRRAEVVISTKVGYGIPGFSDWTYDCVLAGVRQAMQLMKTDYLDIVHLHSCPVEVLRQGDVIDALQRTVEQGSVRIAAYSGENEHLHFALDSDRFRSLQCSINICDQRVLDAMLPAAKKRGMGIIAKRPVANAPWRFSECPVGRYAEEYWKRWKAMNLDFGMPWQELALRFAAFTWGVDSCIVGTTNPAHLQQNAEYLNRGKLPQDVVDELRSSFRKHDNNWLGQV
ncbi:MAG: aldo/keto reductase [Ignavibacteriales bacterium]|nr:aldo/keto reductase [Ignavibacteriales bacterium]